MIFTNLSYSRIFISEKIFFLDFSTFIDFHLETSGSYGACVGCDHASAELLIDHSNFFGSSTAFYGGAVGINKCYNFTIRNSCFARNYASYSPDIYVYNCERNSLSFDLYTLTLVGSKASGHGFAIGSERSSSAKYINQSHLICPGEDAGIWVFACNCGILNIKYIISFENTHSYLFYHEQIGEDSTVNIDRFCSVNDNIQLFFSRNSGKLIIFTDSVFILKKSIELGSTGEIQFDSGCFSNLHFCDSIPINPEITALRNKRDACLNEVELCTNNINSVLSIVNLSTFLVLNTLFS